MSKSPTLYFNRTPCFGHPPIFSVNEDAIMWSLGQGAFTTQAEAQQAFDALRISYPAVYLWPVWIREVGRQLKANGVDW